MNFRNALTSAYCENPCQVLPNAIWKTIAQIETLQTHLGLEKDIVNHLIAWNDTSSLVYWTRDRAPQPNFSPLPTGLNLALVHRDYLHAISPARFSIRKPFFRLIHRWNEPGLKSSLPTGYSFREVHIPQDAQMVSDLIGRCYPDIHPGVAAVTGWTGHPVFDPALWIWVIDDAQGIPIGLGIAEIDPSVREGSLEWIQVLPEYRGRGIGKGIVRELLARLGKRVHFTTVAGEVDNATHPEALYRACGFAGDDIWWLFRAA